MRRNADVLAFLLGVAIVFFAIALFSWRVSLLVAGVFIAVLAVANMKGAEK